MIIQIVGVGLLLNGAHLLQASWRKTTRRLEVIWFSLGDLAWWLASLALVAGKLWITMPMGIAVTLIVGVVISILGVAQLWMLGLQSHRHTSAIHRKSIARSWLALPLWVKIWLFALNAVFLFAFAYWPSQLSIVTIIAYVATAPLLAAQMAYDGGLRRILGLAHLVPWLPFFAWLVMNAGGDIYPWILASILAICLVFDIADVWRFLRGERLALGVEK